MWLLALLGTCGLLGFDIWVTKTRIRLFGPGIELNPLIRWAWTTQGITGGLAAMITSNAIVITLASLNTNLLCMLFGAKLGLASLQLRSIFLGRPNGKSH